MDPKTSGSAPLSRHSCLQSPTLNISSQKHHYRHSSLSQLPTVYEEVLSAPRRSFSSRPERQTQISQSGWSSNISGSRPNSKVQHQNIRSLSSPSRSVAGMRELFKLLLPRSSTNSSEKPRRRSRVQSLPSFPSKDRDFPVVDDIVGAMPLPGITAPPMKSIGCKNPQVDAGTKDLGSEVIGTEQKDPWCSQNSPQSTLCPIENTLNCPCSPPGEPCEEICIFSDYEDDIATTLTDISFSEPNIRISSSSPPEVCNDFEGTAFTAAEFDELSELPRTPLMTPVQDLNGGPLMDPSDSFGEHPWADIEDEMPEFCLAEVVVRKKPEVVCFTKISRSQYPSENKGTLDPLVSDNLHSSWSSTRTGVGSNDDASNRSVQTLPSGGPCCTLLTPPRSPESSTVLPSSVNHVNPKASYLLTNHQMTTPPSSPEHVRLESKTLSEDFAAILAQLEISVASFPSTALQLDSSIITMIRGSAIDTAVTVTSRSHSDRSLNKAYTSLPIPQTPPRRSSSRRIPDLQERVSIPNTQHTSPQNNSTQDYDYLLPLRATFPDSTDFMLSMLCAHVLALRYLSSVSSRQTTPFPSYEPLSTSTLSLLSRLHATQERLHDCATRLMEGISGMGRRAGDEVLFRGVEVIVDFMEKSATSLQREQFGFDAKEGMYGMMI